MKNAVKKALSIMLVAVMLFGAAPLNGFVDLELFGIRASAVEETDTTISGTIGTKLSWEIDKATKVLTIDNNGAMVSFASDDAPWKSYKSYFNSVVVGEGCTNIGAYAFSRCDNIVSVDLPDTIETIGDSAFCYCESLQSINIPDSVISIGDYAFCNCFSLEGCFEFQNIASIGYQTFYGCDKLTSVSFNCTNLNIGTSAFYDCNALTSVSFECYELNIGSYAFEYCKSLTCVSFECTNLDIGRSAFYDCDALTSVSINCSASDEYNYINSYAFYDCDNLESAIISVGVDSIDSEAFANCPKLKKVTIYNKNCEIAETAISIYSTIYGYTGSTAETFANTYGYNFVSIDTPCEHTYSNDCDDSCNICGETRETGAHSYCDWSVIKETSCTQTGLKERTCSICGDVEKEIIEMLPHTDEDEDGICEVCKKQFEIKYPMHGVCGENLTWTLSDDGVLTIEGTGAMYDFKETNYVLIPDGSEPEPEDPRQTTIVPSHPKTTVPEEIKTNAPGHTSIDDGETTNTTKSSGPAVTHPDWYYPQNTTSYYTKPATTKAPAYIEEATTVPSTTRPESTTAPARLDTCAVIDAYDSVDYPAEGYIKIMRWNLHFDKIKKVVISEGVTSIGDYAFANCPQLTEVEMADSITSIGYRAFSNCTGLEEIEIPENVHTIERYAFQNCSLLKTLNFNAQYCSNMNYESFYNVSSIKVLNVGANVSYVPGLDTLETVTFAEGATTVPSNAFSSCTNLTSVTLPDTITAIGERAFYDCISLESINIPDSVTTIGRYAFYNCSSLTSITIPQNVTSLGYEKYYSYGYAFYNCSSLETVVFNAYNCDMNRYDAFYGCPVKTLYVGAGVNNLPNIRSLETVTFAEGATTVPNSAFSGCANLTSVTLPDTITTIGENAFYNCSSLASFNIPDSVTTIGIYAFYNCSSLTSITIPQNVISLGYGEYYGYDYAFYNCSSLETVVFNAYNCDMNRYYVFYGCPVKTLYVGAGVNNLPNIRSLETVTFAEGATVVPGGAFANCTNLKSVHLPDSIETIEYDAFEMCEKLKNINFPQNLSSVGCRAFYCCYSLESADLPASLKTIGQSAFDNCIALKTVNIPGSVELIDVYAFYGCISIPSIVIPESVSEIGCAAFGSCYALESVEFNAVDCSINNNAYEFCDIFYGSDNISSVKFGSNVTKIPQSFMKGKTKIKSVVIPSSVKEIGPFAFRETSISSIEIPQGVETIGVASFSNINTLEEIKFNAVSADFSYDYFYNPDWFDFYTSVFANTNDEIADITLTIGDSVEVIPDYTFAYTNIKKINFGSNVQTIGESAFDICYNLDTVSIPENVKTIKSHAFANCSSLTETTIPESVELIEYMAFDNCESLETVNFNAVECYSDDAFINCENVKTVNIGNNVESISEYAFTGCSNLEKVYIPDIAINIHPFAFNGCGKVAIVCKNGSYANVYAVQNGIKYILEDNATGTAFEIRNDMLLGYSGSAQNIVLPSDISSVGLDAFKGNGTVKSIEIPYSVSKIYSGAFANCSKLERVIIPFTVTDISASAFTGTNAKIYCYYNSYAYNFAVANGIPYELITVTLSANSVNIVETQSVSVDAVSSITLASGIPLVWKSNNPAVASVDSTGKIVGNSVGATTVGVYDINGNMLDECSVSVGDKVEIEFEKPSTDTLKYGEKIVLHINTANLPDGATVKWTTSDGNVLKISNENATCGKHTDCVTCTVESVGNGSAEITGTVVDKNGNPIIQGSEEVKVSYNMKSKAGFFQKIIAFFKKLFGLLKTYSQEV